jgi:hypothetical protein
MSLLEKWLARFTNRIEAAKDRVAVAITGRCRHRTHQEMLAARSYCPDCRRRYADWAGGIGLDIDPLARDWARHGSERREDWS